MLTLSICIVAYNEEKYLPALLEDLKRQKYPHSLLEIVLIDGMSTDRSLSIMRRFQERNQDFASIQIYSNPKKNQAAGWNVAVAHSSGDVIARIDAHSVLPPDYAQQVIKNIEQGEDVVGGIRPSIVKESADSWKRTLLQTENSLFGSGIGFGRHGLKKSYVKTMFHAAYRREVFDRVGPFNEKLLRTEDNEMHFRIRQAGYRLYYDPQIVTYQYARDSLCGLIKQKYENGYWIGATLRVCPKCLSLYHFAPFLFLLSILITTVLCRIGRWQASFLLWFVYGVFSLCCMLLSIKQSGFCFWKLLMPILFLLLHLSYGIGTLIGIFCSFLYPRLDYLENHFSKKTPHV